VSRSANGEGDPYCIPGGIGRAQARLENISHPLAWRQLRPEGQPVAWLKAVTQGTKTLLRARGGNLASEILDVEAISRLQSSGNCIDNRRLIPDHANWFIPTGQSGIDRATRLIRCPSLASACACAKATSPPREYPPAAGGDGGTRRISGRWRSPSRTANAWADSTFVPPGQAAQWQGIATRLAPHQRGPQFVSGWT